ncbi:hypothetical protein HJC23_000574, partial [Cyclotella cryptica]
GGSEAVEGLSDGAGGVGGGEDKACADGRHGLYDTKTVIQQKARSRCVRSLQYGKSKNAEAIRSGYRMNQHPVTTNSVTAAQLATTGIKISQIQLKRIIEHFIMAPTMDIDETNSQPKKKTHTSPSASAESASPHPSMSLVQDIHRLVMVHSGKLSKEDACQIMGMEPEALLKIVMDRVGTGGKSVQDAIKDNEERLKHKTEGGETAAAAEKGAEDELQQPLLNPSLYQHLVSALSYPTPLSPSDLAALTEHHKSSISDLKSLITKAQEEAGDMEVLAAKLTVARYCTKCCSKEEALEAYEEVVGSPKLSVGKKLDGYLEMARVCSFWGDWKRMGEVLDKFHLCAQSSGTHCVCPIFDSVTIHNNCGSYHDDCTPLDQASKVIEKGGDWDRRNRLKAYRAISYLLVRDLQSASKLLVDGIATFSCTELCDYSEFITYAVVTSLLHLPRTELKKSIIDGSEILQVANDIPVVLKLANTLYDCDYKQFLHTLVAINHHLIANRYLQPHAGYIIRELHVLGFRQFLDSYQSVTLESMAASFGVSIEFLDLQLSRFIASGRLTAKIDNVGGIVETNRPDWKNARYREMIQKGDLLLNRIQKLGRVVDL